MKKLLALVFDHLEDAVTVFFFFIMCIFVFLQLFFRYFLNNPLLFTEELSRFSYVWITFIGLSLATKRKEHINIGLFTERLPDRPRCILRIFVDLITLGILIYLFVWGVIFTNFFKVILAPALEFSMIFVAISLPIGFALAAIRTACILYDDIMSLKELKGEHIGA